MSVSTFLIILLVYLQLYQRLFHKEDKCEFPSWISWQRDVRWVRRCTRALPAAAEGVAGLAAEMITTPVTPAAPSHPTIVTPDAAASKRSFWVPTCHILSPNTLRCDVIPSFSYQCVLCIMRHHWFHLIDLINNKFNKNKKEASIWKIIRTVQYNGIDSKLYTILGAIQEGGYPGFSLATFCFILNQYDTKRG